MLAALAQKTQYQATMKKLGSVQAVMQRVVRIVSGSPLNLVFEDPSTIALQNSPGWTNGKQITLNKPVFVDLMMNDGDDNGIYEVVKKMKGVCYHEVAHVLYTPPMHGGMVKRISNLQDAGRHWWAFVALEDQRIETLFTTKYAASISYFNSAVAEWITKTPEGLKTAHLLIRGRKYLDKNIRREARMLYASQGGDVNEANYVIDAYLDIVYDGQMATEQRAIDLIKRYVALMPIGQEGQSQPSGDLCPTDMAEGLRNQIRNVIGAKGDKTKDAQKAAQDDRDKADESDEAEDADSGRGGEDESGKDDSTGDDSSDGSSDGSGGDTKSEANKPQTGKQGGDAGKGNGGNGASANGLVDAARDLMENVDGDTDMINDIMNTIQAATNSDRGDGLQGTVLDFVEESPNAQAKQAMRKSVQTLRQVKLEIDAEKDHRQQTGRINIRRTMTANPGDTDLFDQWDTSTEEAGGVAGVVMLDISGSMGGRMELACQQMWTIKRSFDKLEIPLTVLAFSHLWHTLYRPSEKARQQYRLFEAQGGTDAIPALREASRLLLGSDRPNRVLVTITDGGWASDETVVAGMMDLLHRNNTSSLIMGVGGRVVDGYGKHSHQVGFDTPSLTDVPKAVNDLVKKVLTNVSRNIQNT